MSGQEVVCQLCGWRGTRVYAIVGSLPYTHQDREGFGRCPKCGHALARRIGRYRARKDAAARAQLQAQGPDE